MHSLILSAATQSWDWLPDVGLCGLLWINPLLQCAAYKEPTPNQLTNHLSELTNSIQHSPCWEANISPCTREISHILWTWRFIITFTRAFHLFQSWARCDKSMPSQPISLRTILISSLRLCLCPPRGLFPSGFPPKSLYSLLPVLATCPAYLILCDLITQMISPDDYKSWHSSLCTFLQSPLTSSFWHPNILPSTLF